MKLAFAIVLLGIVTPAAAQTAAEPIDTARLRVGPFGVTPSVAVQDVGIDTNVFFEEIDPKDDFTATLIPSLQTWLRMGPARLAMDGALTAVYFKRYERERSVSPAGSATLEFRGNRLGVSASGGWRVSQGRPNFEIDVRTRQTQEAYTAGADVRLGGKTTVGVVAGQRTITFDDDETIAGASLSHTLNRRETTVSTFLRHALTPLTTLLVQADVQRDRFDSSPARDANRVRVTPGVEFEPLALLSGRAVLGYQGFEQPALNQETSNGLVAAVDLAYTLLARTRFGIQANRNFEYSFDPLQPYYVNTGLSGSIVQALSTSWSLTARAGRQRLDYGQASFDEPGALVGRDVETVRVYGAGVAYRLGEYTQLGVNASYEERKTANPLRSNYEGLRAGGFVNYGIRGR